MRAFKTVSSIAAYFLMSNVDTDMIIPKQYLKTIKRTGLGQHLFAELRYEASGAPRADFILNQPTYQNAHILLTEENFGCGSSREHAVWSLMDFGIQVIIAPSFADIFYSNCFKNGLLPIILPAEKIHQLAKNTDEKICVDLAQQTISQGDLKFNFSLEAYRKEALLKGLDEIGETLLAEAEIRAFEIKQQKEQPWIILRDFDHA